MDAKKELIVERFLNSPAGRAEVKKQQAEQHAAHRKLVGALERLAIERERVCQPLLAKREAETEKLHKCRRQLREAETVLGAVNRALQSAAWRFDRRRAELERQVIASSPAEIDNAIAQLDARLERLRSLPDYDARANFDENQLKVQTILRARDTLQELKLSAAVEPKTLTRLAATAA